MSASPTQIQDACMADYRHYEAIEAAARAFLSAIDEAAGAAGIGPTPWQTRHKAANGIMDHFLDKIIAPDDDAE